MSGRIRTIKPELLEDAVTAGLTETAFRLFIGMILLADDYGNLRAEPESLKGSIFWKRSPTEALESTFEELRPLVLFYEVKGQRYASIRNWSKHQRVSHPGKPRIPAPQESIMNSSGGPPDDRVPDHRPRSPITDRGSPSGIPARPPAPAHVASPVPKTPEPPTQTTSPDAIELTAEFEAKCVMAGAPKPTPEHVAAFLANAKAKGYVRADWLAEFFGWMLRERNLRSRASPVSETRLRALPVSANGPSEAERERWELFVAGVKGVRPYVLTWSRWEQEALDASIATFAMSNKTGKPLAGDTLKTWIKAAGADYAEFADVKAGPLSAKGLAKYLGDDARREEARQVGS